LPLIQTAVFVNSIADAFTSMNKQGTGIICMKFFFATSFSFLFGPGRKCNHFVQQTSSKKKFFFRNVL